MKCPFCTITKNSKHDLGEHVNRAHPLQARKLKTVQGRRELEQSSDYDVGIIDLAMIVDVLMDFGSAATEIVVDTTSAACDVVADICSNIDL